MYAALTGDMTDIREVRIDKAKAPGIFAISMWCGTTNLAFYGSMEQIKSFAATIEEAIDAQDK